MSEQSYSPVARPPSTPGFPQNPIPTVFQGFEGLNTKASQQGIKDQEMFVCDGFMPLGPNNLRSLRGLGTAIYTASGGRTIKNFSFNNLGSAPLCIVCLSDGSLQQVNLNTLNTTQIAAGGTITTFPPDYNQWAGLYIIIVSAQTNGYFLWDGNSLFKAGTLSPQVVITDAGTGYTSQPTITAGSGVAATGNVLFSLNPSNGDTLTLNGVVITFVSGAPTGNQVHIDVSIGLTIGLNLINFLTASTNPLLTVASYTPVNVGPDVRLDIVYNSGGTIGNSYTLAASVAVPSAGTLTGGTGNTGIGASFSATVINGSLTTIHVENPGHGFAIGDAPVLTITGGGSDDMASGTLSISPLSGIASVVVTNGGSKYSALASAFASGGGGAGATFTLVGNSGVITGISVLNPGTGYTSTPVMKVTDVAGSSGSGATATAVLSAGQIGSASVISGGSGYTTPPTLTVIGDGSGASLIANLSGSAVASISIVSAGVGYTQAQVQFTGGNRGAAAVAELMPYGVQGTTVETYQGRVWVGNGRVGQVSAAGSPSDFTAEDGAAAFQSTDSFLRETYVQFTQSNGFLYLFADSSLNYISGVATSGNPPVTTFNNLNVDPQIGTPWHGTVQPFGRDLVFANPVGVFVSYGGAVTKVSDALDGIYNSVPQSSWPAGFTPSAAVMTIFGIRCYILTMPIINQVTGNQVVTCLMWDGRRWWTSPQEGMTNPFVASQDFNSVLTAYCSPSGTTIRPMFTALSELFMRYLYSKLWDNPGVFTTKVQRQSFGIINVNYLDPSGTSASGAVFFPANPSPGDTIRLNSVLITFVASGASGNQINIDATAGITIGVNLLTFLTGSVNPLLTVATYSIGGGPASVTLFIAYNTPGSVGNTYGLAASAATPTGSSLTGGSDGPVVWLANITENGIGSEVSVPVSKTGPFVLGPVPVVAAGRLMGVRFRTAMADIQINAITLINQIQQTNI